MNRTNTSFASVPCGTKIRENGQFPSLSSTRCRTRWLFQQSEQKLGSVRRGRKEKSSSVSMAKVDTSTALGNKHARALATSAAITQTKMVTTTMVCTIQTCSGASLDPKTTAWSKTITKVVSWAKWTEIVLCAIWRWMIRLMAFTIEGTSIWATIVLSPAIRTTRRRWRDRSLTRSTWCRFRLRMDPQAEEGYQMELNLAARLLHHNRTL